ncbi:MAG: RNA polymerase sigma factor SigF, partial [Candidatus Uhrbacteria bacterium]|nr:RNA polymerase sigma factor SigF [Candidatus Uhrbacteria bacterium]
MAALVEDRSPREPGGPMRPLLPGECTLVRTNLRLVLFEAKRFIRKGALPYPEVIQAGTVGLMMACVRWDPSRGTLATIAIP